MEVHDSNGENWLIEKDDGTFTTKTKSSELNQLLYGHELWGLIDEGTEVWMSDGAEGEPKVTVIPDENAECYTLRVGEAPDLTLGKHHKTDLVDAMADIYNEFDNESVAPLLDLYDSIRENMVRQDILSPFLDAFGDKVGERDDGWFINGHLLLTYESEFHHPGTDSRKRSGQQVIGQGSAISAYNVSFGNPKDDMNRDVTVDGQAHRLTDAEVEFLARAVWAIENTPDRR
jgi:hypothetical protein